MGGTEKHPGSGSPGHGHEKRDINLRGAWILLAGIAIAVPLAMFAMDRLFHFLAARQARNQSAPVSLVPSEKNPLPPEPRLQANPALDLEQYRREQGRILGSYGWVDKKAGKVRIPVDRAIEILSLRGLPARAQSAPTEAAP